VDKIRWTERTGHSRLYGDREACERQFGATGIDTVVFTEPEPKEQQSEEYFGN
jgi:hypothetical protein